MLEEIAPHNHTPKTRSKKGRTTGRSMRRSHRAMAPSADVEMNLVEDREETERDVMSFNSTQQRPSLAWHNGNAGSSSQQAPTYLSSRGDMEMPVMLQARVNTQHANMIRHGAQ